jgi:hypothetical protein
MIGRDERTISRAPAAEHGQGEHARLVADAGAFHKSEMEYAKERVPPRCATKRGNQRAGSTNIQNTNLEAKDLELGV